MNFMASTEIVTARPPAISIAIMPPAMSICDMIHPPKMSPLALVSLGIGEVRRSNSPSGYAPWLVKVASSFEICRATTPDNCPLSVDDLYSSALFLQQFLAAGKARAQDIPESEIVPGSRVIDDGPD